MSLWLALRGELRNCLQLFLPAVCLLCQEPLPDGYPADRFCPTCADGLPAPAPARCPCCAVAHRTLAPSLHHCESCLREPPPFVRVHALGPYQGTLRTAVHRFKYRDGLILERPLGCLLAETVQAACAANLPDLLVPVPLHADRLRRRGYNQALQLARQIGRQCGIPLAAAGLRRLRETPPQQGLDARVRRTNLRGAFAVAAPLAGRRVLLVDDVMTTGVTARECAGVLRQAGVAAVEVAVLGRA
jgi:ComF family protein